MIKNGSARRWDGMTSKGDTDSKVRYVSQWFSTLATGRITGGMKHTMPRFHTHRFPFCWSETGWPAANMAHRMAAAAPETLSELQILGSTQTY